MLTVNNNQSIKFLRVLCDLRERPIFMVSGVQAEHDDSLEKQNFQSDAIKYLQLIIIYKSLHILTNAYIYIIMITYE